jgi:hypothetical protein
MSRRAIEQMIRDLNDADLSVTPRDSKMFSLGIVEQNDAEQLLAALGLPAQGRLLRVAS